MIVNKNQDIEGWKQLLRSHGKLVAEPRNESWALKIPDFPALNPTPLHGSLGRKPSAVGFPLGVQVSILSSFESRLMKLENSIIPVHKQTENLQRLQENVEKTLSCLDHVISYYHVAKDTEKIIKEG